MGRYCIYQPRILRFHYLRLASSHRRPRHLVHLGVHLLGMLPLEYVFHSSNRFAQQAHIRFRAAWKKQNRSLDLIPFRAYGGVAGSWLGLILCIVVLAAQIFVAIAPPGQAGVGDASNFFKKVLALPVVVVLTLGGYLWKGKAWLNIDEIDLDRGLRQHDWDTIRARKAEVASWPSWRRAAHKVF